MPAYSSHCIFARELPPFLYTNADFEINEDAVMIGTQGPDIFFFHRIFPWMPGKSLRKTGSALHRARPGDILEAMRVYCSLSNQKDIAKSYVSGFIMHYALDRRCHPYVYSFQDKMLKSNPLTNPHTAHNTIEMAMDSYLLSKRFTVQEPALFDTSCTVTDDETVLAEAGRLYSYVINRVLGNNISEKDGATAIRDMKKIQELTSHATVGRRFFINIIDVLIAPFSRNYKFSAMLRPRDLEKAKKYGNINNEEWKSPFDNSIHFESFEDLFELAKLDAMQMIKEFQNGESTVKITNNISFLTGVQAE